MNTDSHLFPFEKLRVWQEASDQHFFDESELMRQRQAIASLSAQLNALHQSQLRQAK